MRVLLLLVQHVYRDPPAFYQERVFYIFPQHQERLNPMTTIFTPHLRPAMLDDLPQLSTLMQTVFSESYGAAIPDAILARYLTSAFSERRLAEELEQSKIVYLLATWHNELCGVSCLAPHALPETSEVLSAPVGEITRFYLAKAFRGRGVAAPLLRYSFEAAQQLGWRGVWLCVWEKNLRALAFYRKHGFVSVGYTTVVVGPIDFHDHVMFHTF